MPKSKLRKSAKGNPEKRPNAPKPVRIGSGRWVAPTMITLFLLGLLWIVVFYLTRGDIPVMDSMGNWNILIGFGFIGAGFVVATRWK